MGAVARGEIIGKKPRGEKEEGLVQGNAVKSLKPRKRPKVSEREMRILGTTLRVYAHLFDKAQQAERLRAKLSARHGSSEDGLSMPSFQTAELTAFPARLEHKTRRIQRVQ
jgi:hypothetical protein